MRAHETIHLQSLSDKRRHAYAFIYSLPTFRNFRPLSLSSYRGTGTKCRIQQGEHDEESDINRITLKAMRGMQIDSVPIKVDALSPDSFDYKIH